MPFPRRLKPQVILLGLISLLNDTASEMIFPLLPLFLTSFAGATPMIVGMIEGSADALSSILKLVAGWWSDRVPARKPFIILGYGFATISRYFIAIAHSWHAVFFARMFDRTGKGMRSAPRDAVIADVTPPEERGRAFGFHRAMDHSGAVIGPLIAALLLARGMTLRHLFMVSVIPGLIGVILLLFFLSEPKRVIKPREIRETEAPRRLPTTIRGPLLSIALFYLANSSDVFLLLQATAAGVAAKWLPLMWSAHHLIKALFSTAAGSLSDRTDRRYMLIAGWSSYALIYFLFPFSHSLGFFFFLFIAYAIPFTLAEGTERAWMAGFVSSDLRGRALGTYYLIVGFATLAGTALFGWIYQYVSHTVAFRVGGAIALVAALSVALQLRRGMPMEN
ncbi:MAG TPA: MFS transporter [Thermoanaerobaculia bacterium]|nr:MFS transporter [Thermoanaerobaculia bacterium]